MRGTLGLLVKGLLLGLAACSSGDPEPDAEWSIAVTGDGLADTILAQLPAPLVVTVRRNGQPAPNVWVQFLSRECPTQYDCVGVAPLNSELFLPYAYAPTDSRGEVRMRVQLGAVAGIHHMLVRTVDSVATDSARFEIRAGSPATLWLLPRDTALQVGREYPLAARVTDQGGNVLPVAIALTSSAPGVAAVSNNTVRGLAPGQVRLTAHASTGGWSAADTVNVTVVPPGRLLTGRVYDLAVAEADGSGRSMLPALAPTSATWAPDGQRVAWASRRDGTLSVGLPAGPYTALIDATAGFTAVDAPAYSPDGQWLYFSGQRNGSGWETWRVASNGGAAERVGPPATSSGDYHPSLAPDGTRFVFGRQALDGSVRLFVRTLADGGEIDLGVAGRTPAWSRDGTTIAFWAPSGPDGRGSLYTMPASGGTPTDVLAGRSIYEVRKLEWSPDGTWLITGELSVALIRVSDRLFLSLPWSRDHAGLSWTE